MDIKVNANELADGSIDWGIGGKKPHQSSIRFEKDSGSHKIDFKFVDHTGRRLKFDCSGPIWSHKSETDCPPAGAKSDQIRVLECSAKKLTIRNENCGDPCTIHYQLNFVDADEQQEEIDPEFKNGGGN